MILTMSGRTLAVRSSVVPLIWKLWPVVQGYLKVLQIWLDLARKADFVSTCGPEGVEKVSSGSPLASLLVRGWALMHEMELRLPDCEVSTIFSPACFIFVWGRRRVCVCCSYARSM